MRCYRVYFYCCDSSAGVRRIAGVSGSSGFIRFIFNLVHSIRVLKF